MVNYHIEVREERGKYTGFVITKDDEYPASLEMTSHEAARAEAAKWAKWMFE